MISTVNGKKMLHTTDNISTKYEYLIKMVIQVTFTCSKPTIDPLKKRCEICSKLTIKTPERRQTCSNFEHISQLFLVFLSLTLNK